MKVFHFLHSVLIGLLSVLVALVAPPVAAAAAPRQAVENDRPAGDPGVGGGTIIVPIQGELSEKLLALTIRSIRVAHETNARALVFEIDTEGGAIELMDRLIDEIERADDLKTVAFVTQKAASAGAAIAISCQRLYMKPGSNIGSALVIAVPQVFGMPISMPDLVGGDPSIAKKVLGHYRAHFRAKAQAHDRPGALAAAMVFAETAVYEIEVEGQRQFVDEAGLRDQVATHGEAAIRTLRQVCKPGDVLNLTAQEALADGMIDGLATSRADLLGQLGLATAPVHEMTPSWSELLADFTQRYGLLLLITGLIAIFIEVKLPGFGLPGILGTLLVGLYLFGKYLAGLAEITEILLIVAGFGLIAVEVLVLPGTLVSGILGVVAIVSGLVLTAQQTSLPVSDSPFAEAEWWSNVRSLSVGLAAGVAGMVLVAHYFPNIPFLNRAVLRAGNRGPAGSLGGATIGGASTRPLDEIDANFRPQPGARGIARTVLRPSGKVEVEGRELDAVSEGPLVDRGQRVLVVRVEAAYVVVRPDDAAP